MVALQTAILEARPNDILVLQRHEFSARPLEHSHMGHTNLRIDYVPVSSSGHTLKLQARL